MLFNSFIHINIYLTFIPFQCSFNLMKSTDRYYTYTIHLKFEIHLKSSSIFVWTRWSGMEASASPCSWNVRRLQHHRLQRPLDLQSVRILRVYRLLSADSLKRRRPRSVKNGKGGERRRWRRLRAGGKRWTSLEELYHAKKLSRRNKNDSHSHDS